MDIEVHTYIYMSISIDIGETSALRSLSLPPLYAPLMSSCLPHTCMRAVTHVHTHTRTERRNGPVHSVLQQARGSGSRADGGDQARERPGPAGRARGVIGSVYGVRSAAKERGRGQGAELGRGTRYALLGPSDQLQGGGAWKGQGTDV